MRLSTSSSRIPYLAILVLLATVSGVAAGQTTGIFGVIDGTVADPQHRPAPQVDVTLRAKMSSWQAQTQTTDEGRFAFTAVPAAEYTITATKPGFQTLEQRIVVRSGTVTSLALTLSVGSVAETVRVTATEGTVNLKAVTTQSQGT